MHDAFPINKGLRLGAVPQEFKEQVRHLQNALDKMPKYNGEGPLKRDFFFNNKNQLTEFIDDLKFEGSYKDKGFCSTSNPDGSFEGQGLNGEKPDVRMYIDKWKTGVNIQEFSEFDEEGEVLFLPKTEFKFTDWYEENGTWIFRSEEK